MGRINRTPSGLLDLLQSKTDGKNPQDLAETVAPTLDLLDLYLLQRISHEFIVTVASGPGATNLLDVTEGEVWGLFACGVQFIGAAVGQTMDLYVSLQQFPDAPSALSQVQIFAPPTLTAAAIGDQATAAVVFDRPIWLTPGLRIRLTSGSSSLSANASLNMSLYRLQI